MTAPRIPPNFLGIPFGIAGLGVTWATLADAGHVPTQVGQVLFVLAGAA